MNPNLKEMESIYCLEIPKGIHVQLYWGGVKGMWCLRTYNHQLKDAHELVKLFDTERLFEHLKSFGVEIIEIYGIINGPCLTFSPFDVKLNSDWISVPLANELTKFLKFNFVKYSIVSPKEAEFQTSVILRPIQECIDEDGRRIIEEIK